MKIVPRYLKVVKIVKIVHIVKIVKIIKTQDYDVPRSLKTGNKDGIPSGNQRWLAGKSTINGGF